MMIKISLFGLLTIVTVFVAAGIAAYVAIADIICDAIEEKFRKLKERKCEKERLN